MIDSINSSQTYFQKSGSPNAFLIVTHTKAQRLKGSKHLSKEKLNSKGGRDMLKLRKPLGMTS